MRSPSIHWPCWIMLLAAAIGFSFQPASPEPFASSQELLQSIGVDESHFHLLVDGQPLDESEQEPLLRFLYAVRKCPPEEARRFAQAKFDLPRSAEASIAERGAIYRLKGKVTRVTIERPLPEVVDRYEMKQYYRCRVELESGQLATVFALDVAKAWSADRDISQPMSCTGFYLKLEPGETENTSQPVFASQRLAWHPEGLLGSAGMDFGLFDDVENKAPIGADERECFYQLLSAVGRIDSQELFRLTARQPDDDYSVVPLFNDPANQHGKLVALTGTARRAMLVRLDEKKEADLIARLGFDHYYQVEIFTGDSQGNPLVFCVRSLPPGFPEGPHIYETVRIPGVFFKTWSYRLQSLDDQPAQGFQLAPMLIGHSLQWIPQQSARDPLTGAIFATLLASLLILIAVAMWAYRRTDRRFHEHLLATQRAAERQQSLNDLNLEARDGPDFSNLP